MRKIAAGSACIRNIQRHASIPAQKWAGEEGADEAADEQGGDSETEPVGGRPASGNKIEGPDQAVLGAVDGTAVITEQESADRRHGNDRADKSHIRTLRSGIHFCIPS